MLDTIASLVIDGGLQTIGWGAMKTITFGRYRSLQPDNMFFEQFLGTVIVFIACYGAYRWLF